jgi:hypothetical protein
MPTPSINSLEEHYARELSHLATMVRSGVAVAVPAALNYCAEHELWAPPWLLQSATDLVCDLLIREKSNRRGRSAGYLARYRQDLIDYARWDEVDVVRRKQLEILEEVQQLQKMQNVPPKLLKEREKMLAWVGSTLNRAFECASMLLQNSNAFGSPEAIKRSYFQVRRNSRDPRFRLRYHLLDSGIQRKLGLNSEEKKSRTRKQKPFYELTL